MDVLYNYNTMSTKLNSLSPAFVTMYYRNQSDEVKQNLRRALGLFPASTVNLGKVKETKINS